MEQARSAMFRAQSEIRAIDAKLRDSKSLAPFDGVIVEKFVEEGDTAVLEWEATGTFTGGPFRGFHLAGPGRMEAMFDGEPATLTASDGMFLYQDSEAQVVLSADTLEARKVELNNETNSKELSQAVETAVLYKLVSSRLPFADG